jgi:hypothetical protein
VVKCSYDSWQTKVPAKLTAKEVRVMFALIADGPNKEWTRVQLLRLANIDPNPVSENGYPGNEKTDYYLYKHGMIELATMQGTQKVFKLTPAGKAWL